MREVILILGRDIVVRFMPLPNGMHGFCVLDEDSVANVYLNANDPEERQKKALKHELLHIVRNDHYRPRAIAEAEVDETLDNYEVEIKEDRVILREINKKKKAG